MTLILALLRNLRTWTAMPKGKGTSGDPVRPKVPMRRTGADCSVVVVKWGNAHGANAFWKMSESMGNHDSEVVDASSVD